MNHYDHIGDTNEMVLSILCREATMNLVEFKHEVEEAVDLYLTDYFSPLIEWDFEDQEDPKAYITIALRDPSKPYILTVDLNDGEPQVQAEEDSHVRLDDAGFMTALFFEAHNRLCNA